MASTKGFGSFLNGAGQQAGRAVGKAFGIKPQVPGWGGFLNAPINKVSNAAGKVQQALPTAPPRQQAPPPTDQMPSDYLNAYHASFAQARGDIENQFRTALQDLSGRENLSQGVVNSLPGRYAGVYNGANAQLDQQAAASLQQQQGQHLQSFAPADAGVAAQKAAMTAGAASRQADVPLVQAGVTSEASRMRGGLGQARLGALADISTREDEANIQAQRDAQQARQQWDMAKQQHDWSVQDRQSDPRMDPRYNPTWAQQRKAAREDALWQQGIASGQANTDLRRQGLANYNSFGQADISADRGNAMRLGAPQQYKQILNGPAYQRAVGEIGSTRGRTFGEAAKNVLSPGGLLNTFRPGPKRTWQDEVKKLQQAGKYRAAAVLAAKYQGR